MKPWDGVDAAHLERASHIPALLSLEEKRMIYHYARHLTHGAIVELGSFLGGSLGHFLLGAAENPTRPMVHAFDRFRFGDRQMAKYFDPLPTARDLELVQSLIAPLGWAHFHQGELAAAEWDGSPIGLLFIDIAKNPKTMDLVIEKFYPSLVPGALIIQQDYQFPANPWVAIHAEQFGDVMRPIAWVEEGKSVVFEWAAGLEDDALMMRSVAALDNGMRDAYLRRAARRFAGSIVRRRLDEMVALTRQHGHWARAHDYFRLRHETGWD